jgi:hypothetical protein
MKPPADGVRGGEPDTDGRYPVSSASAEGINFEGEDDRSIFVNRSERT